ncbi:12913_t:CDS:2, partial [Gigaspora margarita]
LNLVGKDSAEEVSYFKNYEVVLKEIYAYFAISHQKWQHLKLFQSLDNKDLQLAILRVVSTRWLSLSNAVSNLHQIIFSIKDVLYDEAFNDSCTKTRQWAKALYDDIDSEFILATKYLADILSIINDDIAPTCGYYLREYINDTLEFDELPSIFKEFALAFIKNLCQRFPNVGIYNAIQIFDFSQIPVNTREMVTFGENEIQVLEAKLGLKNYKELGFVEGWKRIFDSSQFIILYPNESKKVLET